MRNKLLSIPNPSLEQTIKGLHGFDVIEPLEDVEACRQLWANYREANELSAIATDILTSPSGNQKISKNSLPTWSLSLAASDSSGIDLCPWSTAECETICLGLHSGRNEFENIQNVQRVRTWFLTYHPREFVTIVKFELERALRNRRRAVGPRSFVAARLNAYSDIRWERLAPCLFMSGIRFYDYTKAPPKVRNNRPANYHLTYSINEKTTERGLAERLSAGPVAIVGAYRKGQAPLPTSPHAPVIDGDKTDARYRDSAGVIVYLSRKGSKLKATSPFIREDLLKRVTI